MTEPMPIRSRGVLVDRASTNTRRPAPDEPPARCRSGGCDGDPDTGDGWDGYCPTCADRLASGRPTT